MLARTQRYQTLRFILEQTVDLGSDVPDGFGHPGELVAITCEGGDLEVAIDDFDAAEKLLASPRLEQGDLWVTFGGGTVEGYPVLREAIPHGANAKQIAEIVVELENQYACEIIRACEDEAKPLWEQAQAWPEERIQLEDRTKAAEDLLRLEFLTAEFREAALNLYVSLREELRRRDREMEAKSQRLDFLKNFREEMKDWHGELVSLESLPDTNSMD